MPSPSLAFPWRARSAEPWRFHRSRGRRKSAAQRCALAGRRSDRVRSTRHPAQVVDILLLGRCYRVVQRNSTSAALNCAPAASIINQDLARQTCRDRKEMCSVWEFRRLLVDESKIGLVHQFGASQRVVGTLFGLQVPVGYPRGRMPGFDPGCRERGRRFRSARMSSTSCLRPRPSSRRR